MAKARAADLFTRAIDSGLQVIHSYRIPSWRVVGEIRIASGTGVCMRQIPRLIRPTLCGGGDYHVLYVVEANEIQPRSFSSQMRWLVQRRGL